MKEQKEKNNINNFCHLHLHSTYSFTDGYGLPEQYIGRAVELGQPGIAVTDHGNISVHYKWYKTCNKAGIKPVLGCEFYIVEKNEEIRTRGYNHITVLVKNNIGYSNLTKLVTKAWTEQFYYKPRITFQQLFDNQEGLIVLSGCLSSPIMQLLKDNNIKEAEKMIERFNENIEEFYIEVQPISFPEGKIAYERLVDLYQKKLKKKGYKWVASNDCHYVLKEHQKIQEVLLCIQSKDTMDNPDHWKFDQDDFYLKSRKEMEDSLKACFPNTDFTDALDESLKILDKVDFEFPKADPIKFPIPDEEKVQKLRDMCEEGMIKRGLFYDKHNDTAGFDWDQENEKMYRERLERELDIIVQKNFVDYFLVVADLVQWSKKQGILVGPARGSAAGSLACYALEITEVEPIRYDLIFERFIDLNREDLPDIDIDFEDVRRHEVKEYLEKKYGRNRVGNLPTFAVFKGKSAIDDVGGVFRIPLPVLDKVKSAIVERSGGDSRASFTLEDTFASELFTYPKEAMVQYPELKHSIEIEGQLRHMSQHAAGMVISNEDLNKFCALYKVKESYVTSLDYKDVSDIGLLKMDILGLKTLSVVSLTLRLIKERHKKNIDIYHLPLNDPKTYQGFVDGKLFAVFQFNGQAVNQVCRQIAPRDFDSLSAISALARPGPLNSGSTTMYINRRAGREKVTYPHHVMEDFTKETYGIVIYQEQVMRTMRELGKMSWKDTSEIRKLISRSQGVEKFNTFKEKFAAGAHENGMRMDQIDKVWDSICTFGSWAFNKSHSVSYSIISYWTMWLKMHYPMEFYSSVLALEEDEIEKKKIIKEYKQEGFKVLPIDINKSKQHFTIENEGLRIGFADIKNIGIGKAQKIVKNQPYESYFVFDNYKMGISDNTKQNLIDLGAFDSCSGQNGAINLFGEVMPDYQKKKMTFSERFDICPWDMEFNINKTWIPFVEENRTTFKNIPMRISELKEFESKDHAIIWGIAYDKNPRDGREVSSSKGKTLDPKKYLIVKLLNPAFIKYFKNATHISRWTLEGQWKNLIGLKRGLIEEGIDYVWEEQYTFMNFLLEDDTDFITVRMSHIVFPQYGNLVLEQTRPDDVLMIKGKMGSGIRMFFANKILNLRLYKELIENKNDIRNDEQKEKDYLYRGKMSK